MKRLLILMMGVMVAFASCQKDSALDGRVSGEEVSVTLSAVMGDVSSISRTAGDGTTVDRCILEVYSNGTRLTRMVEEVSGKASTFEVQLVPSQEYEFLLWADKSKEDNADNFYDTDGQNGLKEITADYTGYIGNDENRDAFYCYSKQVVQTTGSISLTLSRPFAQVNVKSFLENVESTMYPETVKVNYSTPIANTFKMADGIANGADISASSTTLEWSAAANIIKGASDDATRPYYDLSTDYLFAPADAQDVINFTMDITLLNGNTVTNDNFTNIPIRRNYQTNISGELLTTNAKITATISEGFNTTVNNVEVQTIPTATDLNETLTTDKDALSTSYIVSQEVANDTEISIPATTATGASRSITLEDVADNATVTFTDANAANSSGSISELYITIEEGSNISISVNMPNSTIYINGTEIVDGEVWSSENTTIIAAGSKITGTLTVKQGNVEIYGEVADVTLDNDNSIIKVWTIYNDTQLTKATALGAKVEKIVLAQNISLSSGVTLSAATTIDGAGNSMTFSNSSASISCSKNLTIENITISNTGDSYAIYVPENSSATEINITDSTLSGYAAIYTKGDGATYNITGSTLNGDNTTSSSFATICLHSDATGNTINLDGTTINTSMTDLGYQYGIDIREATGSTTVNLSNGTKFHLTNSSASPSQYFFIKHGVNVNEKSTFTRDNTITYSSEGADNIVVSLTSGLLFGKGTEESPYEIYDNHDLKLIQYYTNYTTPTGSSIYSPYIFSSNYIFAHFKQMADIEYSLISMSNLKVFPSPLTTYSDSSYQSEITPSDMLVEKFCGVYDGNGFSINNWGYNSVATGSNWGKNASIGLFRNVYHSSTIKNLTLTCDKDSEGIVITDTSELTAESVGAFAGELGGTIENCVNEIPISVYTTSPTCRVGGIYGKPRCTLNSDYDLYTVYTKYCTNNANIEVTGNVASAGGIVGGGTNYTFLGVVEINDCVMNGDVTAPHAFGIYVEPEVDLNNDPNYYVDLDENNVCNGTITQTAE